MKPFAVLAFLLAACATVDPGPPWLVDAIDDSRQAHKPLVVEIYTTWCGPCKTFEAKVLPDPRVQEALSNVVFVRYDAERGRGRDAAQRCSVRAYPTFLGIDKAGRIRLLKKGTEATADEFLRFLEETRRVLGRPPA